MCCDRTRRSEPLVFVRARCNRQHRHYRKPPLPKTTLIPLGYFKNPLSKKSTLIYRGVQKVIFRMQAFPEEKIRITLSRNPKFFVASPARTTSTMFGSMRNRYVMIRCALHQLTCRHGHDMFDRLHKYRQKLGLTLPGILSTRNH